MPLYEYVCEDCKRKTEVLQRLREKPLKICPHCGGRLRKAFSAPAIQFKGSGFYVTDYARGTNEGKSGTSPRGESESRPAESTGESKTGESKKEKTGETKTESKKDSRKS